MENQVLNDVERMLSETLGKQVTIHTSGAMGGGCISNASKLETSAGVFFLKWNTSGPADMFIREAEGLRELKKAANNDIVVPEVIAAKRIDNSPGFLVQEYLEPGTVPGSDEMLGRGLAVIHRYGAEKFGFHRNNYCGSTPQDNTWKETWAEFYRDNRLGHLLGLIRHDRPLPKSEMAVYDRLLERIPDLVPESTPVLIHGDLWSGNYLSTANGPALIDPAAYYADREMEMGIMTMFGGFSSRFYGAYNEINPLPAGWRERNPLYRLYHELNHYYLFGGGYSRQSLQSAKRFV